MQTADEFGIATPPTGVLVTMYRQRRQLQFG